jgi:hypothetical protein
MVYFKRLHPGLVVASAVVVRRPPVRRHVIRIFAIEAWPRSSESRAALSGATPHAARGESSPSLCRCWRALEKTAALDRRGAVESARVRTSARTLSLRSRLERC